MCFTRRAWHSTWKTDQQIMSRLARTNRVLYVNPPRPLRSAVRQSLGRARRELVVSSQGSSLYVYQEPVFLPGWGRSHLASRAFNHVVQRLRIAHLRRTAMMLGFRSPILWCYDPLASWAIGLFGEKLFIYGVIDNYDEYFSAGEVWRTQVYDTHRKLLRCADVVFAVSEPLLKHCLEFNPNSFLAPNGVSFELFGASMQKTDLPREVRGISRPIIGFAGALHSTVDFGLLEKVATERADWSLMLVGPVEHIARKDSEILGRIRRRGNVYYLGAKTPEELPDYIKCFDVALMPYRIGPLTASGDSLKLYEYLACGLPVVSTAISAARRLIPLVEVAEDVSSFVSAIERVLKCPDGFHEARLMVARNNSWDRRIDEMSEIVLACLKGKIGPGSELGNRSYAR